MGLDEAEWTIIQRAVWHIAESHVPWYENAA